MKNYNEFNKSENKKNLDSGRVIFDKSIAKLEGNNVEIDGVGYKVIIRNQENIYSPTKEYRNILFYKDIPCKRGSYVKYNNDFYMVTSALDDHYYYYSAKMQKCENILKWRLKDGSIVEFPCILSNDAYGVKIVTSGETGGENSVKMKVEVQKNETTLTIMPDYRFMFSPSTNDIYKTSKIELIKEGIITLTTMISIYQQEDDIVNMVAYNELTDNNSNNEGKDDSDIDTPPITQTYEIIGDDNIVHKKNYIYTLNPENSNCLWYLDEDSIDLNIAKIVNQDNTQCNLYAFETLSTDECTLYAKENDVILAKKTITISKK